MIFTLHLRYVIIIKTFEFMHKHYNAKYYCIWHYLKVKVFGPCRRMGRFLPNLVSIRSRRCFDSISNAHISTLMLFNFGFAMIITGSVLRKKFDSMSPDFGPNLNVFRNV